jgi:hypothetical protein
MTVDAFADLAYSNVAVAPAPAISGIYVTLDNGQGNLFPAAPFDVTICPAAAVVPLFSTSEIARCTDKAGDVLTLLRGQYGTSPRAIVIGDQVINGVSKNLLTQIVTLVTNEKTRALAAEALLGTVAYTNAAVAAEVTRAEAAEALLATKDNPTFTGLVTAPEFSIAGLTGAVKPSRLVGANATGAPTTGTFAVNDVATDSTGKVFICTVAGTPGTWVQVGATTSGPGTQLANVSYGPATAVTNNLAAALTAIDTTHATVSFVVPASGKIKIVASFNIVNAPNVAAGNYSQISVAFLNHTGGTQVSPLECMDLIYQQIASAADSNQRTAYYSATVSGLPPGALQIDLAAKYVASAAPLQCQIRYDDGTALLGPLEIAVFQQ